MPATSITLAFADGEYEFSLKLPHIAELEEKCGYVDPRGNRRKKGILEIYGDMLAGRYVSDETGAFGLAHQGRASATEVLETIRLGLIGGGRGLVDDKETEVSALTAKSLVERYCYPAAPLTECWNLAVVILSAMIEGYDPPKKAEPAKAPAAGKRKGSTTRKR